MKRSLGIAALVASLGIACSVEPAGDAGPQETGTDDVTQFVADSTYTELWTEPGCKTTAASHEGEGLHEAECTTPSPRITLKLWAGDLRERATLIGPEGELGDGSPAKLEIDVASKVPWGASWNQIGPKAEWRAKRGDAKNPYALILRHAFETNPEGTSRKQHYLAVVKISEDGFCLAGIVDASKDSANANVIARRIADGTRTANACPREIPITTK